MDVIEELKAWVRRVMGETRYHKKYPCEVVDQAEDYTLSLRPDDPTIAGHGLDGVPIRPGIPGVKVRVSPGARVQLGFENGDPAKRYAALWSEDQAVVLSVELPGDKRPVARKGDPVLVFINPAVPIPMNGLINGVTPFVGTIQITSTVSGIIQEGNPKVLG